MGSTEGSGGKLISVPRQKEAGAMEAQGIIFKREQSLVMSKSVACALRPYPLGVLIMCSMSHIGGLMFFRKVGGGRMEENPSHCCCSYLGWVERGQYH